MRDRAEAVELGRPHQHQSQQAPGSSTYEEISMTEGIGVKTFIYPVKDLAKAKTLYSRLLA